MLNEKVKAKRNYQDRKERTEIERGIRDWLNQTELMNALLTINAMLLFGIFLMLLFRL